MLLAFLTPLLAALDHVVHAILQALLVRLQVHVLALPVVPTPPQEPRLHPRRRGILALAGLAAILTKRAHLDLLIQVLIEVIQPQSATKTTKTGKPNC